MEPKFSSHCRKNTLKLFENCHLDTQGTRNYFLDNNFLLHSGQDSSVGKASNSQAEKYWVRSLPQPQKALNMSDF
jgi:hypothetical protein